MEEQPSSSENSLSPPLSDEINQGRNVSLTQKILINKLVFLKISSPLNIPSFFFFQMFLLNASVSSQNKIANLATDAESAQVARSGVRGRCRSQV